MDRLLWKKNPLLMLWNDVWQLLTLQAGKHVIKNHLSHFVPAIPGPARQ
jgi:hypothetical protein